MGEKVNVPPLSLGSSEVSDGISALFDLLESPALEISTEMEVVRINPAARRRLPRQTLDDGLAALFSAEDLERLRAAVRAAGEGRADTVPEVRFAAESGEGHAFSVAAHVIPLGRGRAMVCLGEGTPSELPWWEVPFALFLVEADGRIRSTNRLAQALCGAAAEQLAGRPLAEWVEGLGDDFLARGETAERCRLRREDGTVAVVEVSVGRSATDPGTFVVEIRNAPRYRGADEFLGDTSRAVGDRDLAYWVRDVGEDAVYWSEDAHCVLGLPASMERAGRELFLRCLHPEDRPRVEAEVAEAIADREASSFSTEFRTVQPDGGIHHVRSSGRIARDGRGAAQRLLGTIHDITAERAVHAVLRQERRLTDSIFEVSAALLVVSDPQGRIVRFNGAAERLSGFAAKEVEGRQLQDLFVLPEERQLVGAVLERLAAGENLIHSNTHWRGRNGNLYTITWSDTAIRNEAGELEYVVCTGIDITAVEEAAVRAFAVERAHARDLEVLGGISTVGIFKLDAGGRLTYANQRLAQLVGIRPEEAMESDDCLQCLHPEDRSRFVEGRERAFRSRSGFREEIRFVHPDGRVVWALFQVAPEFAEDGELHGYLGTVAEITELKELSARLGEAEASARRLVESSFDMVLTVHDGVVADINPAGAVMLGAQRPELLRGRPVDELFAQGEPPFSATVAEGKRCTLIERRLRTADGREVEVEGNVVDIVRGGRPLLQAVFRDISRRKEAEQQLRLQEEHFHTLAGSAPVGIFQADPHGLFTYANARALEIAGVPMGMLLADAWQAQIHPEDRTAVVERTATASANGLAFGFECRVCRPDGSVVWVLVRAEPQRNEQGAVSGYVGSVVDISRRKEAELELEVYRGRLEERVAERTAELEAVNRELEAFSYSVSHDLRAPLRAINGFGRALWEDHREVLDGDGLYLLNRIRANSLNMAQLVEELLEFSRANSSDLKRESIDLAEFARAEVAELCNANPGREVETDIVPTAPAWADPTLVRVLLRNLLENAWKYTGSRPHARVEFGMGREEGRVHFYVRDNGIGFDPALAHHLFRPFQRLHGAGEFEGTGIGLATVQRIVNRHGGRVWADAREGEGATFYFTVE